MRSLRLVTLLLLVTRMPPVVPLLCLDFPGGRVDVRGLWGGGGGGGAVVPEKKMVVVIAIVS